LLDGVHVLVAGVGNIFLGDDGFGSEVARRLARRRLPDGVRVTDYGIGGIHLAYDLLGDVELLVLVDALPRGVAPGTVTLLDVGDGHDLEDVGVDSHAMDPASVFASVKALGGALPPTVVVGCEPAVIAEQIGLSPQVEGAVEPTVEQILELLAEHLGSTGDAAPLPTGADSTHA
jgi:hydrogenase maturation protease